MIGANRELQASIFQSLSSDASLTALLGGPKIFDRRPQSVTFPYLTLGQSTVVDWSTGSEDGAEHILTLHVWARGGGKRETYEIMDAVTNKLHDAHLPVKGQTLVNLRLQFAEARREPNSATYHGILRFRAVTEPLSS